MRRPHIRTCLLVAGATFATASPALSHSEVEATRPVDASTLTAIPRRVTVTYGAPLGGVREARVTVGSRRLETTARIDPGDARRILIPIRGGTTGAYVVEWVVLGSDGHPLEGSLRFQVRTPTLRIILAPVIGDLRTAAAALGRIG
ncbi:MAG: copper resistance protein CopC [Actinobacteria bacterium]|nr:copper resistance protein CopC [Thermoleophilia bacterium]MCB9011884.1 copper resistance protein CopC [Actinomycetota bacterium]